MSFDSYRPFIAKALAPFIGLAITALNKKYGFGFTETDQMQALTSLVDLVVFALSTGLSGVMINKKVNPGNAASAHLAGAEKAETQAIKAKADMYDAARGNQ